MQRECKNGGVLSERRVAFRKFPPETGGNWSRSLDVEGVLSFAYFLYLTLLSYYRLFLPLAMHFDVAFCEARGDRGLE